MQRILVFSLIILTGRLGEDGIQLANSFLTRTPTPFLVRDILYRHQWAFRDVKVSRLSPPVCVFRSTAAKDSSGLLSSNDNSDMPKANEFVEAEDLEALQALFSKYCDKEGLMTKSAVMKVPAIAELMEDDDLLPEEFDDIWDRAPKFPDTVEEEGNERIDVDSFVQVYRDIDDLFENDDEDDESGGEDSGQQSPVSAESKSTMVSLDDDDDNENDDRDVSSDGELEAIYESLSDKAGLLSKNVLRNWEEVQKLIDDGLLGEDEFDDLWQKTKKSPIGGDDDEMLDVEGFLSFNVALDDLFDFEDEDMEDLEVPTSAYAVDEELEEAIPPNSEDASPSIRMVVGSELSPDTLFVALANSDGLVGLDELKRWSELEEMLEVGDLLESELISIFESIKKSEKDLNKLEEEGFIALYKAIDDLFEDDYDNDDAASAPVTVSRKDELLDAIADLEDENLLPCGLEATELEQKEVLSLIEAVEKEPTNLVRLKQGAIEPKDLKGTWNLLYSSSSAMKFNKGLSGLGGSFPNGRFKGLQQKLDATKVMTDVEYIERIEVNPSSASFDVKVTGSWDLRSSVSLFTGEPSIVMTVEPDRVSYGPTSTRADHWKSLGPMNMLDITYLDDDLRIMRGNTSVETVFVFRRTS